MGSFAFGGIKTPWEIFVLAGEKLLQKFRKNTWPFLPTSGPQRVFNAASNHPPGPVEGPSIWRVGFIPPEDTPVFWRVLRHTPQEDYSLSIRFKTALAMTLASPLATF